MNRFKIEVFKFNNKAEKEILFERNMEVSTDFSVTMVVDNYLKVLGLFSRRLLVLASILCDSTLNNKHSINLIL